MKTFARILVGLLMLSYPFLVYWGVQQNRVTWLVGIVLVFALVRIGLGLGQKTWLNRLSDLMAAAVGLVLVVLVVRTNNSDYFLIYPVMVNLIFLVVFAISVKWPPTVIERLARLQEPDLPPEGVAYTRTVTLIWCGFFVANGAISIATITMGMDAWILYNGLIAYLLMGLLFAGEYAYRKLVLKK